MIFRLSIKRLALFEQVEEHLEFKAGTNGCTVIDDTWNSSPLSMTAALQVLKESLKREKINCFIRLYAPARRRTLCVEQYEEMGKKAVETGVDLLVVVGEEAKEIG